MREIKNRNNCSFNTDALKANLRDIKRSPFAKHFRNPENLYKYGKVVTESNLILDPELSKSYCKRTWAENANKPVEL